MNRQSLMLSILIVVLIVTVIVLGQSANRSDIQREQQEFAESVGVRIEDYSYPGTFPLSYFDSKLSVGMSKSETHSIISGYEKVLKCNQQLVQREIYYFFSSQDFKAIRIEVWYSDDGRFLGINSEDQDSRTIRTEECAPGLRAESIRPA